MRTMVQNATTLLENVTREYNTNSYFTSIVTRLKHDWSANTHPDLIQKQARSMFESLTIERAKRFELNNRGTLYHIDSTSLRRMCISAILREIMMREAHDAAAGGHFGSAKTYALLARRLFWSR